MHEKEKFNAALPVMQQLVDHGYEAYFVGGSVRDFLMQRPINDIDMTTNAMPDEVEALFDHTIPIGKEHGTINVVWQDDHYEITTFRTEGDYIDHRRPSEVTFVRDLYQDVERRDFTINAIAMDQNFKIKDYFNGQHDIQEKIIRTVGNPIERFEEDALRILRGLRFQSQLGFSIAPETYEAMMKQVSDIEYLAIERIMVELEKLLSGLFVEKSFESLQSINVWQFLPYFKAYDMQKVRIHSPVTLPQFLAIIMYQMNNQSVSTRQLKRSKDEIRHAEQLLRAIQQAPRLSTQNELRQFIYDFGKACCLELLSLQSVLELNGIPTVSTLIFNTQTIEEIWRDLTIKNRQQLAVDGKILMTVFDKKAGPWLKETLRYAECAVVQNKVTNIEQEIIEWVKQNVEIS
ncbi:MULTISPECIES: CCA tRNA nucleotidyltransferase [unclassified Staphylococcus]|uniref:CCA tRNA nucleotidyltransferase n=1 Tax=unclassified Staphylococcus TaxID=91994 RepID=UPI0021CE86D2|nr:MULTISPECIES: CCA tRNA nucleotidyltransferase [unclassified Staphylococcus]UXR68747.1 CCA tRNA nucleotidyltransferase [Staphylococcus sp. IVB6246]UXR70804.1 CCA tRNA nucleotidyltransferase [Staphylococcus sp. IVB6240]UXR75329.1 CCA tRNA nucleotidyltransferase [Staphylococcus sp. IVB6233]